MSIVLAHARTGTIPPTMRDTSVPPVNDALVRRLESASVAFSEGWLRGIAARPGNPRQLRLETFGDAFAAAATGVPDLDFMNRVHGLRPEDAHHLPAILAFYAGTGIRPWFELFPTEDGVDRVAGAVARAGAVPESYATFLYGTAAPPPARDAAGVGVGLVAREDVDAFAEVLLRGHGVPEAEVPNAVADHRHWPDQPGWTLYVATVGGDPAAAAVLQVRDGIGYLANAATLPAFRGRGCQTALLVRRIADAEAAGCELVAGQATFGSTSQRNMQRLGLVPACTVTTWRALTQIGV
jgi:ribosomal protein S18 acetylase RimI-like enzyme